jgi:hypothetical protein
MCSWAKISITAKNISMKSSKNMPAAAKMAA